MRSQDLSPATRKEPRFRSSRILDYFNTKGTVNIPIVPKNAIKVDKPNPSKGTHKTNLYTKDFWMKEAAPERGIGILPQKPRDCVLESRQKKGSLTERVQKYQDKNNSRKVPQYEHLTLCPLLCPGFR